MRDLSRQPVNKVKESRESRSRVALGAALVPGRDDDLISWYLAIPYGRRSDAICSALRAALGLPLPEIERVQIATHDDLSQLRTELDAWSAEMLDFIRSEIRRIVAETGVSAAGIPIQSLTDGEQLDRTRQEQRKSKIKRANW